MSKKTIPLINWLKQGEEKFKTKDVKQFKFKCPNCGGVQSAQDFIDNNIEESSDKFFFSCIGRWVKERGCDWTLGGLFQIHETEVISDEGKKVPVFEFAE